MWMLSSLGICLLLMLSTEATQVLGSGDAESPSLPEKITRTPDVSNRGPSMEASPDQQTVLSLEALVRNLEGQLVEAQTSQARTRSVLLVLQEKLVSQEEDMRLMKDTMRAMHNQYTQDHMTLTTLHTTVSDSSWAMADLKNSQDRLHADVHILKLQQEDQNDTILELQALGAAAEDHQISSNLELQELAADVSRLQEQQRNDRQILQSLLQSRTTATSMESSGDGSSEDIIRSQHEESRNIIDNHTPTHLMDPIQRAHVQRLEGLYVDQDSELSKLTTFYYNLSYHLAALETRLLQHERQVMDGQISGLHNSFANFTQHLVKLEELYMPAAPPLNSSQSNEQMNTLLSTVDNHQVRLSMLEELVLEYRASQVASSSHIDTQLHRCNATVSKVRDQLRHLSRDVSRSLGKLKDQVVESSSQLLHTNQALHQLHTEVTNQSLTRCSNQADNHRQEALLNKFQLNMESLDRRVVQQDTDISRLDRGMSRLSSAVDEHGDGLQEAVEHGLMVQQLLPVAVELQHEITNLVWQLPPDCSSTASQGAVLIRPIRSSHSTRAYCVHTPDADWTVIQRRLDGTVDFAQGWDEYRLGFGNPEGEFWLGTENLHYLSTQSEYLLHIDMWDLSGQYSYAQYEYFKVDEASTNYRLHVDGYRGNATDALTYSNFMPFSTQDQDNDASSTHCAKFYTAGWWYKHCHYGNLNGRYALGVVWFNHDLDEWVQLRRVEMKIRPLSTNSSSITANHT